ncbi:MAG: hypothetical protein KC656_10890, partial [Myxococcales bacterium]|nr:hypothetical protein [Myxococcales bacterium]
MRQPLLSLVLGVLLVACKGGGGSDGRVVTGRLTEDGGAQARLAGSGSLAAAVGVEAHTVGSGGTTTLQGEASIEADGSFIVSIPDDATWVVVYAVDAEGGVVGSVVVEPMPDQDEVPSSPITTETSAE